MPLRPSLDCTDSLTWNRLFPDNQPAPRQGMLDGVLPWDACSVHVDSALTSKHFLAHCSLFCLRWYVVFFFEGC